MKTVFAFLSLTLASTLMISANFARADHHKGGGAHQKHEKHSHKHKQDCGHKAEQHGSHTDYEHDGHHHKTHGKHMDECAGPEADEKMPEETKTEANQS
jgi:hypothetical protein